MLAGGAQNAVAAGLGRLVVFSALGQPLRAEIEVTATREELADMKAQLASVETFKQVGLDYAVALQSIRFNLEKRPNGQAVIKLSSERPINDPFVDMLLELNWSAGRLVREYTFLLDPPEYAAKASASATPAAVVSAPVARPGASAIDSGVRARAMAQVRTQPPAAAKAAEPALRTGEGREVRRGETLHRIASETKLDGVSLDQMLVGLFRANPDAFEGGNMNRLRSGAILTIPEKSAVESVPAGEARKVVLAQSSDWNAYRSKLAGAAARTPVKEDAATQEAAGKITAKVDDKAEHTAPKDQLKVSKTEQVAKKGGTAAGRASEEELIAKEKALKEANERMVALEKNVADLQKLLELRNQNLADLQKQSVAKPEPAPAAAKPAEPPKPAEAAPAPTPAAQPAPAPATPKVEAPAPAEPPVVPAKPAEPKPAGKPKVAAPPPPPPEEPSFFEDLLGNPMTLAGGGGILALIAAYFYSRRRRAAEQAGEQDLSSTLTPPSTTSLTANSVFRSTGGQSVDTSSQAPAQTDFSQAGPGSIDTDEVDPVAEADVYMAYGRDAQAEEILLEAKQKDPKRVAIHLKLLEIYSGRNDIKKFETVAAEMYGETAGVGPEWEKAAAMGRALDADNPLFRGAAGMLAGAAVVGAAAALAEEPPQAAAEAMESASPRIEEPVGLNLPQPEALAETGRDDAGDLASLDFDLGELEDKPAGVAEASEPAAGDELGSAEAIDFDLRDTSPQALQIAPDLSIPEIAVPESKPQEALEETMVRIEAPELDFDIGTQIAPAVEQSGAPEGMAELPDLDFDLGSIALEPVGEKKAGGETDLLPEEAGEKSNAVEFDVSLTESTFLGRAAQEPPSFDISSIDLDLTAAEVELPQAEEKPGDVSVETVQMSTAVNPDFAAEQIETLVAPQEPAAQGATEVNPDFATEQAETLLSPPLGGVQTDTAVNPDFEIEQAETLFSPQPEVMQEPDVSASEEVATKLDLAKAYEEMGDLEGARELLQEVMKEGDAAQRETAQNLLAKIG